MAGVLIFLLIDLKKPDNEYIQESQKNKEAYQEAKAITILTDIKKELEASFVAIENTKFVWNTQAAMPEEIPGWSVSVSRVNKNITGRVGEYLEKEGFKQDVNNIADGVVGYSYGYIKVNMVCEHKGVLSEYKENSVIEDLNRDLWNVQVYCGYLND